MKIAEFTRVAGVIPIRRTLAAGALALSLSAPPVAADQFDDMSRMVGLMGGFFDLMEAMYDAASNPEHAALIQMNSLEDLYKGRGEHAAVIPVYREILQASRNPTVRRIAYLRLADALKETGHPEEAIKVLRESLKESVASTNTMTEGP
ncbi:MAG: tetratricopeptide repeat protein [Gammaproteobacteria bacterium]|nr:tetratricopeptide repeat protein [Gammaproteobacteria bacterium]NNM00920.1 tetratricopeptide repeat protein [Gammaproteobacteria bacterium]